MFTTRDIRGIYGRDITIDKLKALSKALNQITTQLTIGMDYRAESEVILRTILSQFQGNIRYLGRIPTPVAAYLAEELGICVTASHNPPGYNGVKFFKPGRILFANEVQDLENKYLEVGKESQGVSNEKQIELKIDNQLLQRYLSAIPEIQDGIFDLCGGAACIFKGIFPCTIFAEPDPTFQRHSPEPKDNTLEQLKLETKRLNKIGYAFDGDSDRVVLVVDGHLIPGDILIGFIAEHYLKRGDKIILSFDCSQEVFEYIKDIGRCPIYAAVGQNLLIAKAMDEKAAFIGEYSGHYSFNNFMYYSDPIYTVGKISDIKPIDLLNFHAQFKNIVLREKVDGKIDYTRLQEALEKWTDQFVLIDGIKAILADDNAAILIRHSQSEPITRVNVEAGDLQIAQEIFKDLKKIMRGLMA